MSSSKSSRSDSHWLVSHPTLGQSLWLGAWECPGGLALGHVLLLKPERWGELCIGHKNENRGEMAPQRKTGTKRWDNGCLAGRVSVRRSGLQ